MSRNLLPLALVLFLGALIWMWPIPVLTPPESAQLPLENANSSTPETIQTAPDPTPAPASDIVGLGAPLQQAPAPITAFRDWTKAYLSGPQNQREAMLPKGAELAKAHTLAISEMIPTDPQQAIASAVPMVVRQDLPDSIVNLLEQRVSMKAALEVYGNVPLPGEEAPPDFKPYTRSVTKPDGRHWNAFVYGKRASQRTISTASINGISVGNNMAVADSS